LYRHHAYWTLSGERLPWTTADRATTPDAETLWAWASGRSVASAGADEVRRFFEVPKIEGTE
jgi:hypothetical protein